MSRRSFVLAWGRKQFFGISWPVSSLLGLIYIKSYILPQSFSDWVYYIATFIGHFGLLNALVYFLVFCPLVLLMPTYYISRFWSLILILILNLLILADGLFFSSYQVHIYEFFSLLVVEKGIGLIFSTTASSVLLGVSFFVFTLFIWLRGEWLWRHMQGRFRNPIKNWYLVIIFFSVLLSKSLYFYGTIHPSIANLFPLNINVPPADIKIYADNRAFFYPSKDLSCQSKPNDNLILITLARWSKAELNPELMPNVDHMKKHAKVFNSHYAVSSNEKQGLFTLRYSIPASYNTAAKDTAPAFYSELTRRQYEIAPGDSLENIYHWITKDRSGDVKPYFMEVNLKTTPSEADKIIQELVIALQKEHLLKNTHIIITGSFAGDDLSQVPLLMIHPDRAHSEVNYVTSHYDVMPTFMNETWNCKRALKVASIGKSLEENGRDWLLISQENGFKILDFKKGMLTVVDKNQISDKSLEGSTKSPRHELIFEARKLITKFSRPW